MLLYPLEEAIELLSTKLSTAKKNLSETIEDLEWLREQATVMEVNFARVHNVGGCHRGCFAPDRRAGVRGRGALTSVQWDVKRRREAKARGETTEATEEVD